MDLDFKQYLLTEGKDKDTRYVTTVAVFRQKGSTMEVLIEKRGNPPEEHEWSLPGGHIAEKDGKMENYAVAACREIREETGLKLTPQELIYITEIEKDSKRIKGDILFTTVIAYGLGEGASIRKRTGAVPSTKMERRDQYF